MKLKKQKVGALILTASLSTMLLVGCTTEQPETPQVQGGASVVEHENTSHSNFRAADVGFGSQERYDYPYMGLSYTLPESLMNKMDEKSVIMLSHEAPHGENESIGYAQFMWSEMNEIQREVEVDLTTNELDDWVNSLMRIGTLGIYHSEMLNKLDELTGCIEHIEIGQSVDGTFKYFLSVNPNASSSLITDIKQIKPEITEIIPYIGTSAFDMYKPDFTGSNVGEFESTDIHGNSYSQDIFSKNDLTLVNIFATWCTPCVEEIPFLQELSENMSAQGVGVVGIVMDTVNSDGSRNEEAVEKSIILEERSGAKYPFLIPDSTNMNGRLDYVDAYPETFFVDKDGKVVGEVYLGGRDLAGWTEIVKKELANLRGGN